MSVKTLSETVEEVNENAHRFVKPAKQLKEQINTLTAEVLKVRLPGLENAEQISKELESQKEKAVQVPVEEPKQDRIGF